MSLVPFTFGPKAVGGVRHRTPPFFKTKKVGLLGSTASIQFAPWGDPSWTLMAHPCCRNECKREPDWYFDMHVPACFKVKRKGWNPDYYDWLQKLQTPIFMQEQWPEIPMAVRYPVERVLSEYRPYFSNHCAWMIALAMTEGVTHIGLWGCQYSHESERGHQRGSLEYWLGRFEGGGGKVVLPPKWSNLLADPRELYGYESHDKEGKLVESYRPKTSNAAVVKDSPSADDQPLTIIKMDTAEGRPALRKLPDNMEPAWERSGHLIHV